MLIRCEKCSTLYELDEKLLPPQGAPVQCSKCQFVFKAYPRAETTTQAPPDAANEAAPDAATPVAPEDAGQEPAPSPRSARERTAEPPPTPSPSPSGDLVRESGILAGATAPRRALDEAPAGAPTSPAASDAPRFTADGRPIRKVPFPTPDASAPGVRPTAPRVPPPRASRGVDVAALMRWVVVAVVLLAVAIGVALAWRTFRARPGSRARAPVGQSSAGAQGGTTAPQPRN